MIVTDDLIKLMSFCEAHKYRKVVQTQTVSEDQAIKASRSNIKKLKEIDGGDVGSVSFYCENTKIGFTVNVIKEEDNKIYTAMMLKTSRVGRTDEDIAKLIIAFFHRQGFEVLEHHFMQEKTGEQLDTWLTMDYTRFKIESRALAFWIHGLVLKKFKPHVPRTRCFSCKLRDDCKNFLRYNQIEYDSINTEPG